MNDERLDFDLRTLAPVVTDRPPAPTRDTDRPPAPTRDTDRPPARTRDIAEVAAGAGLRRIEIAAWRDLDHPEAGGSEIHAARIAERWAAAGMEVRITASRPEDAPPTAWRDGYRIRRPAGRYGVFPAAAAEGLARRARAAARRGAPDATVEIWNGMPFLSPLWAPRPRVTFLHHVHDRMWDLVLPRGMAAAGRFLEARLAPPLYRRTPVVTLSESSRQGIVDLMGLSPDRVHVVAPGVDATFRPGPIRHPFPLVVAVGRLVPYKRFDLLVEDLVRLRRLHPRLQAVIAGEGSERRRLEHLIASHGAAGWIGLPGRVGAGDLLSLYQRAWVLASPSAFEGWGLTISEAAACATPAVVSPIAGHRDALADGITGYLARPGTDMVRRLDALLSDPVLRSRMQGAARERAASLTWDRTALRVIELLAAEATEDHGVGRQQRRPPVGRRVDAGLSPAGRQP